MGALLGAALLHLISRSFVLAAADPVEPIADRPASAKCRLSEIYLSKIGHCIPTQKAGDLKSHTAGEDLQRQE